MRCSGQRRGESSLEHVHRIDHVRRPEKYFCWRAMLDNRHRYRVDVMGYGGGFFEGFHRLSAAREYFDKYRLAGPTVQLLDIWYHHVGCDCWNTPGFLLAEQDNRETMPKPETYPLSAERTAELAHVIWPSRPEIA